MSKTRVIDVKSTRLKRRHVIMLSLVAFIAFGAGAFFVYSSDFVDEPELVGVITGMGFALMLLAVVFLIILAFVLQHLSDEQYTEYKKRASDMVEESAESENMLYTILRNVSELVTFKNREHRIVRCSESVAELFDVNHTHELTGKVVDELVPARDAQTINNLEDQVMRAGKPMRDEVRRNEAEWPNGSRPVFLESRYPWFNHRGHLAGIFEISRDISEYKRVEADNKRASQLFMAYLSRSPVAAAFKSTKGRFLRSTGSFERLVKTSETLVGKSNSDVFPIDLAVTLDRLEEVARSENEEVRERVTITVDGEERDAIVTVDPCLDDAGELYATLLTIQIASGVAVAAGAHAPMDVDAEALSRARAQLEDASGEIATLKEEVARLQSELEAKGENLGEGVTASPSDDVSAQIAGLENSRDQALALIAKRDSEVSELREKLKAAEAKLEAMAGKMPADGAEAPVNAEMKAELEAATKRIETLIQERDRAKATVETQEAEINRFREEVSRQADLAVELESARKRIADLEEELKHCTPREHLEDVEKKLNEFEHGYARKDYELDQINERMRAVSDELHAKIEQLQNAEKRAAGNESDLRDAMARLSDSEKRIANLQDEKAELEVCVRKAESAVSAEDYAALEAKLTVLEEARDNALATVHAKTSLAETLSEKVSSLEKSLAQTESQLAEAREAATSSANTGDPGASEAEFAALREKVSSAVASLEAAEAEKAQLANDLKNARRKVTASQQEVTKAERRASDAIKKLRETVRQQKSIEAGIPSGPIKAQLQMLTEKAETVGTSVEQSKIDRLAMAAAAVEKNASRLSEWVSNDPKGKQLPKFLRVLSNHLEDEHKRMLTEVKEMRTSLAKLSEVVNEKRT